MRRKTRGSTRIWGTVALIGVVVLGVGCNSVTPPIPAMDLSGNWIVEATFEKGNPRVYDIGGVDRKRFRVVPEGTRWRVADFGTAYSANPDYRFETGELWFRRGKLHGSIKGASDKRKTRMEFRGRMQDSGTISGVFKVVYVIGGTDVVGRGTCVIRRDNDTALRELLGAIERDDLARAKELLRDRSLLDRRFYHDKDLLMVMILEGKASVASLLIREGIGAAHRDKIGKTALIYALRHDMAEVAWELLEVGAPLDYSSSGWNVLTYAARYTRDETLCIELAERGVDLGAATDTGWTLLHFALRFGKRAFAQYLMDRGVGLFEANEKGWTPLMLAARHGDEVSVVRLVDLGADVDRQNDAGWTPLMLACVEGKSAVVVNYLLDNGAQAFLANNSGKTAIDVAMENLNPMVRTMRSRIEGEEPADTIGFSDRRGAYVIYSDARFEEPVYVGLRVIDGNTLALRSFVPREQTELVMVVELRCERSPGQRAGSVRPHRIRVLTGVPDSHPSFRRLLPMVMNWTNAWMHSRHQMAGAMSYSHLEDEHFAFERWIPGLQIRSVGRSTDGDSAFRIVTAGVAPSMEDQSFFDFSGEPTIVPSAGFVIEAAEPDPVTIDGLQVPLDKNWTGEGHRYRLTQESPEDAVLTLDTYDLKKTRVASIPRLMEELILGDDGHYLLADRTRTFGLAGHPAVYTEALSLRTGKLRIRYRLFIDRGEDIVSVATLDVDEAVYRRNSGYFDSMLF